MAEENKNIEQEIDQDVNFELPLSYRLWISIPTLILIIAVIGIYVYLIFCNPKHLDPEKFGLPLILITLLSILILINIPWSRLGFRVKKIGIIELENVVKEQAQNKSEELADLQKQIDELKEERINIQHGINTNRNEEDELILNFLKQYSQWAFSALRIKNWGGNQENFHQLSELNTYKIRSSLRRLLSDGKVVTRISKKGNTLYKFNL